MAKENPAHPKSERPSLRTFNAHADRNGQGFDPENPRDVARPDQLRHELTSNPDWEAETARIASGGQRRDSIEGGTIETSEATEAETPPETIDKISNPKLPGR